MDIIDNHMLASMLRTMAWERAKGELKGVLHTYYCEADRFSEIDNLISNFINEVENKGLQE